MFLNKWELAEQYRRSKKVAWKQNKFQALFARLKLALQNR